MRLQQLVSGDIQLALVSNYMMNDWELFPVDMPELLRAKQVGSKDRGSTLYCFEKQVGSEVGL